MQFWLFTLITLLIMPAVMIVFGYRFRKGGPKKISSFYGYRTVMSMKNRDTWDTAHRYFGRKWVRNGWIVLCIVLAVMGFMMHSDADAVGRAGLILLFAEMLGMMAPISETEKELKKNFDTSGKRKKC